jgi:hypothetical protein
MSFRLMWSAHHALNTARIGLARKNCPDEGQKQIPHIESPSMFSRDEDRGRVATRALKPCSDEHPFISWLLERTAEWRLREPNPQQIRPGPRRKATFSLRSLSAEEPAC